MISFASASVMGHPFTFCIRVTVFSQPSRSLFFPSGRERAWQAAHFASNSALVLQFINMVTHREGRCAASGKAPRPRRTGQVR